MLVSRTSIVGGLVMNANLAKCNSVRAVLIAALLACPSPTHAGETAPALPMEQAPPPNAPAAADTPKAAPSGTGAPSSAPPVAGEKAARGARLPVPAYVKNEVCVQCHARQAELWTGSQHFKAMARASDATVLGDFNDASFTRAGVTTRFFRRDGKFFVNTEGPDGKLADFAVSYTFGV